MDETIFRKEVFPLLNDYLTKYEVRFLFVLFLVDLLMLLRTHAFSLVNSSLVLCLVYG